LSLGPTPSRGCRNGALPLSAGRELDDSIRDIKVVMPQWSPAFIGRERSPGRRTSPQGAQAAMEPCLYRQGEGRVRPSGSQRSTGRNGALPLSAGRGLAKNVAVDLRERGAARAPPC